MKRALVAILCCCSLLLPVLLVAGCAPGGGGGGQSLDADSLARKYVEAIFSGKADEAKGMMLGKYEYKDEFIANTDAALAVLSQYEAKDFTVASTRPWRGGDSGEVDKRAELQYEFRKKGSSDTFDTGIIYVRVTSSGGGWGITDVILAVPDK